MLDHPRIAIARLVAPVERKTNHPPEGKSAAIPPELLAHAVESTEDGIILYDVEGRIHYANPSAERLYGYAPNELLGRSIRIFEPNGRKPLAAQILRRARKGTWRGEVMARRRDGSDVSSTADRLFRPRLGR
jgi:PAS domain S-box-containing protein